MTSALRAILTPRALAAWAGTERLSTLPLHLPSAPPATLAARVFAVLVAGDIVPLDAALDAALAGLDVARRDGRVRAAESVLPLGRSLLVCDRLDASFGLHTVMWPDDSSYHLALSIPPGRRARWLDVAAGSGFAPLLRPELAAEIVGTDLNPRAVAFARKGAALSGVTHATFVEADLAAGIHGPFDLVTCNAPIPADVGPLWRATADTSFFARLVDDIPRVLAPGGVVVVHGALASLSPIVTALRGDRVTVSYVPDGGTRFGIVWWRPDGPQRHVVGYRELTAREPHLTHRDRDAQI